MQPPLELVRLRRLMDLTRGDPAIQIALIDGPVFTAHGGFAESRLRPLREGAACGPEAGVACSHGTFVAGILAANRETGAPGICSGCTLLLHPIFAASAPRRFDMPAAPAGELASAIMSSVDGGANVLNLSVAASRTSFTQDRRIEAALDFAAAKNVIVVAAAGNEGTLGSTAITRHPWVIPVAGCDMAGRPMDSSNLAHSIATRGLRAPGAGITSLSSEGGLAQHSGTSAAAPYVSATIALLWSLNRGATAANIRCALLSASERTRSIVPRLLDAWSAYEALKALRESNRELRNGRQEPATVEFGKNTAARVSAR
jgi:subtilisin family serine protease